MPLFARMQQNTDSSGAIAWRAAHEAFGKAALDVGNDVTFNLRFPGQYFDEESGLHDNRFRYYSPDLGRYISADPIGQWGGPNVYSFVLNNPLSGVDVFGLDLTVSFDPSAASGFGHVGVGVNSQRTEGLYPATGEKVRFDDAVVGSGLPVPGEIREDLQPQGSESVTIPTTADQDQAVEKFLARARGQEQLYALFSRQCTSFVRDALSAGGIDTSPTIQPRSLFNELRQRYGSSSRAEPGRASPRGAAGGARSTHTNVRSHP